MKKLAVVLATALMATTGLAITDQDHSVHWVGTGDWMTQANWDETAGLGSDWNIPGWVVGNPLNTVPSTDPAWNRGFAHIDSGTVNITSGSAPDGFVNRFYVGSNVGAATVNISTNFTTRLYNYMGYQGTATDVATINQTAGNVSLGTSGDARTYLGRGFGTSTYNLSGGTLATPGDWDNFGTSVAGETGTFVFNQTGGTYTDTGVSELLVANQVDGNAVITVNGGTFQANATSRTRVGSLGDATINIGGTGAMTSSSTSFDTAYYASSIADMNISGGSFDFTGNTMQVGKAGTGTVDQTGGDVAVTRLRMATDAGSSGTYSISGGSLLINNYVAGGAGDGVFEILGSDATSIEADAVFFFQDTLRVKLDENGSTLLKAVGGDYDANIDIHEGLLQIDTLAGFNGTLGSTYDIAWAALAINTTDLTFEDLGSTEFSWSVLDNVDASGNAGTGQMLQVTVIPEPATLGMLAFMGGGMLWIRRRVMI